MRNDLQDRLIDFSVAVIEMTEKLPMNYAAQYLLKQVTRSATSPALNYAESQGAESTKDFVHKVTLSLKELKETEVSLKIIDRKKYEDQIMMLPLIKEVGELIAIHITIINKAKQKL